MHNIFGYESKFMQLLLKFSDYMLLNLLYVACCIPVFTIGAAQAGLYSGLRVLQDKENDSSCLKAFIIGFKTGFGTVTLVWGVTTVITALLAYNVLALYVFKDANAVASDVPFWMSVVAAVVFLIYQTMIPVFHSRFSCGAKQLFRNVFLVIMANPIQSVIITFLLWAPMLLIWLDFPLFIQSSILLFFLYYSVMMGFGIRLMNKSFNRLSTNFNDSQNQETE